jgi:hypothetical protein
MKKIFIFTLTIILIKTYIKSQDIIPSSTLSFPKFTKNKNITAPYLSFDGNYLIFVVIEKDNYNFYECKKNNNTWSEPEELSDINKYLGATTPKNAPVYNYDASEIYFEAIVNENKDIFYSQRTNTGWSEPQKLNNKINTGLTKENLAFLQTIILYSLLDFWTQKTTNMVQFLQQKELIINGIA